MSALAQSPVEKLEAFYERMAQRKMPPRSSTAVFTTTQKCFRCQLEPAMLACRRCAAWSDAKDHMTARLRFTDRQQIIGSEL